MCRRRGGERQRKREKERERGTEREKKRCSFSPATACVCFFIFSFVVNYKPPFYSENSISRTRSEKEQREEIDFLYSFFFCFFTR